jgi:hypothetical protein
MVMRHFHLRRHAEARVWQDEAPPFATGGGTSVAIELFVPLGGMAAYGLLGATLVASGQPTVTVAAMAVQPWNDSVAHVVDTVSTGLEPEFVDTVLQAGRESLPLVPAGRSLVYDCAACGQAGSSVWLFRRLAIAVAHLAGRDADEDDVRAILERSREV